MDDLSKMTARVRHTVTGGDTGGSGLPTGGAPHQQLVTDAEGKALWEDRLAYAETGVVEILPETVIPINYDDNLFQGQFAELLSEGNEYTVNYNGTAYVCVAQPFDRGDGVKNIALGNIGALVGGGDTGEPFVLVAFPPALAMAYSGSLITFDDAETVTLSITAVTEKVKTIDPKFLPGGGKYKQPEWGASMEIVDILSEATYEATEETEGAVVLMEPLLHMPIEGSTYEVNWNGTSYNTVCAAGGGDIEGKMYVLGNLAAEGGPDTGEPFVLGFYDDIAAAEIGFRGMIFPLDGATTITLSIKGPGGEINTIPQKYVEGPLIVNITNANTTPMTVDTGIEAIKQAINSGREVYLAYTSLLLRLQRAEMNSGDFYFAAVFDGASDQVVIQMLHVYQYPAGDVPVAAVKKYVLAPTAIE